MPTEADFSTEAALRKIRRLEEEIAKTQAEIIATVKHKALVLAEIARNEAIIKDYMLGRDDAGRSPTTTARKSRPSL